MLRLERADRTAGMHAHGVLCALVMLVFLRAFIPAGFMPDAAAIAQGRWALVLCPVANDLPGSPGHGLAAADGHAHARAAVDGAHIHESGPVLTSDDHSGVHAVTPDCPCSLLANVAMAPLFISVTVDRQAGVVAEIAARTRQIQPWRAPVGPPLGSRAPPSTLV